jgi:isocitrate dehydrogenase
MLEKQFYPIAQEFKTNEATINTELIKHKGKAQRNGVYYQPNPALTNCDATKRNLQCYTS